MRYTLKCIRERVCRYLFIQPIFQIYFVQQCIKIEFSLFKQDYSTKVCLHFVSVVVKLLL